MGVHGLTTYLRENKRALSTTINLLPNQIAPIPVVVDGWSFIYDLHRNSNLPWVYGGEYTQFSRLVSFVVQSWIEIGLTPYFVFDGPYPELKFPTLVSRLRQSHIQPSDLFFRTSPASRATPRSLHETRIIPPLSYAACIHGLEAVRRTTESLEIHFADEEADPYAVELAGRVGGYVIGNDSDFVIFNSQGYLGYIPLDEMVWFSPVPEEKPLYEEEDGGFQAARNPKAKRKLIYDSGVGRGLIPPDKKVLNLSFTVYNPNSLAAHLKLPVTLLPLLGALVGNDFSSQFESSHQNIQSFFFHKQLTLTQRIGRVAATIQTILSPAGQKRKKHKHQVGSVMDLIDRAVNDLLLRSITTMTSGEIDKLVDKIVEATLQYAIPKYDEDNPQGRLWPTEACALHEPEDCAFLRIISRMAAASELVLEEQENEELTIRIKLRAHYLDAYRKGRLSPKIMDSLNTGTSWPRLFLENPDLETVARSIGRPIREWGYAILQDAVGLPKAIDEDSSSVGELTPDAQDEDELIDVVESGEDVSDASADDLLAPLKDELQRLQDSENGTEPSVSPLTLHTTHLSGPLIITEYLRRGSRVAEEGVIVRPLQDLLLSTLPPEFNSQNFTPLLLRSEEDRLTVFLRVLDSDIPCVRALPPEQLMVVLCLRWVLHIIHLRAQSTGSKEREKERWTRQEALSFLASFSWIAPDSVTGSPDNQAHPPIADRNVQLMAQVLLALESIEHFSQILLLSDRVPSPVHLLSGRMFHAYLTGIEPLGEDLVPTALLEASRQGLKVVMAEERKKKRANKDTTVTRPLPGRARQGIPNRGLFQFLEEMETS